MSRLQKMKKIVWLLLTLLPATSPLMAQQDTTRQVSLQEVTVTSSQPGMLQNRSSLGQLETINRSGLTKMACCTLSASFENSATTQTSYSDAVTGTRQIQMLGLSGIYTQTMAENIPTLRSLGYVFGWDYTPAAWLDGISISKGAGTVGWEKGVKDLKTNLQDKTVTIKYDTRKTSPDQLKQSIEKLGYKAEPVKPTKESAPSSPAKKKN